MKVLALLLCLIAPSAGALPIVANLDFQPSGPNSRFGYAEFGAQGCACFPVGEVYGAFSPTDGSMNATGSWSSPGMQGHVSMTRSTVLHDADGAFDFSMQSTLAMSVSVASNASAGSRLGGFARILGFPGTGDLAFTLLERAVYTGDFAILLNGVQVFGLLEPGRYLVAGGASPILNVDYVGVGESRSLSVSDARSLRLVAVPEPATLALLAAGLLGIGVARRRRSNA